MKKKLLMTAVIFILPLALTTSAFADKPIDLFVNKRLIQSDVAPQLTGGRVVVPVRWVAEALGAIVKWEEENNTVWIDMPELASLQSQVKLLQTTVAPTTPRDAVEKWAKGLKERNGALQYAVLSPELKEQMLYSYESCGWVTGTSSPWIERYEIVKETQTGDGVWEYEVRFELATSTGPAGSGVDNVVVKQYKDDTVLPSLDPKPNSKPNWYVSQIPRIDQPVIEGPPIIVDETRVIFPNKLMITNTVSDYAHNQHIISVEGKFKHTEGDLYLTLLENGWKCLDPNGTHKPDEIKPIDKEWSMFRHKFIVDTGGGVINPDKVSIVFGLGEKDRGDLNVPIKKTLF